MSLDRYCAYSSATPYYSITVVVDSNHDLGKDSKKERPRKGCEESERKCGDDPLFLPEIGHLAIGWEAREEYKKNLFLGQILHRYLFIFIFSSF